MTRLQHALALIAAACIAGLLFGIGLAAADAPDWLSYVVATIVVVLLLGRFMLAEDERRAAVGRRSRDASPTG